MSAATDGGRLDTILAAFTATTMIAHQVAAKTVRDSLFLTYFDVTWLPLRPWADCSAALRRAPWPRWSTPAPS